MIRLPISGYTRTCLKLFLNGTATLQPQRSFSSDSSAKTVHALLARWKERSMLLRSSRSLEDLRALIAETEAHCTAAGGEHSFTHVVLRDAESASVIWKAIFKHQVPRENYRVLLQTQLDCLETCEREFVLHHMRRKPFLAHTYMYQALRGRLSGWHAVSASTRTNMIDESMRSQLLQCTTMVEVAQHVRRWENNGTVDRNKPLLLPADVASHIWCGVCTQPNKWPHNREIISFLALRLGVDQRRTSTADVARIVQQEYKIITSLCGLWTEAIKLLEGSGGVFPRKHIRAVTSFAEAIPFWLHALQMSSATATRAGHGVDGQFSSEWWRRCLLSAPQWWCGLVALRHCKYRWSSLATPNKDDGLSFHEKADTILIGNAILERHDAPWDVALHVFSNSDVSRLRVSHIMAVLEKTSYPHDVSLMSHVWQQSKCLTDGGRQKLSSNGLIAVRCAIHAAGVARSVGGAWDEGASLIEQPYSHSSASIEERRRSRWDIALSILTASKHFDLATPMLKLLSKEELQSMQLISSSSLVRYATYQSHFTKLLRHRDQTTGDDVGAIREEDGDGVVLLKGEESILALLMAASYFRFLCLTPSHVAALRNLLHSEVDSAELSPRTVKLASLVVHAPSAKQPVLGMGCFLYQSRSATHKVFSGSLSGDRRAFVEELKRIPTLSSTSHWLKSYLGDDNSWSASRLTSETAVQLLQFNTDRMSASEAKRLLKVIFKNPAAIRDEAALDAFFAMIKTRLSANRNTEMFETVALKSIARLYASGLNTHLTTFVVRSFLCALSEFDLVRPEVVLRAASSMTKSEVSVCPMAASVVAKSHAIVGNWEEALLFLPSISHGIEKYGSKMQNWYENWLDVVLCVPSFVGQSLHAELLIAPGTATLDGVRAMTRVLKSLWRRDNSFVVRWITQANSKIESRSTIIVERNQRQRRNVLSAALCLLDTRKELFPVAWAVGGPLQHTDVRSVALQRVLRALSWERAISIVQDVQHRCGGSAPNSWLTDAVLKKGVSPDALRATLLKSAQWDAGNVSVQSIAEASEELACWTNRTGSNSSTTTSAPRGRPGDIARVGRCLKHVIDCGCKIPVTLLLRFAFALLIEVDTDEGGASGSSSPRIDPHLVQLICHRGSGTVDPLTLRAAHHTLKASTLRCSQASHDGEHATTNMAFAALELCFVAQHMARRHQVSVPAHVTAAALRVATLRHDWVSALYFFSRLKHPSDRERFQMATALRHTTWRTSLRILSNHQRFVLGHPHLEATLLLVRCCTARAVVPHSSVSAVQPQEHVWRRCCEMLAAGTTSSAVKCLHDLSQHSQEFTTQLKHSSDWSRRVAELVVEMLVICRSLSMVNSNVVATCFKAYVLAPILAQRNKGAAAQILHISELCEMLQREDLLELTMLVDEDMLLE